MVRLRRPVSTRKKASLPLAAVAMLGLLLQVEAQPPSSKVTIEEAENFQVKEEGPGRLVTVRNAWKGSSRERSYLLVDAGQDIPSTKPGKQRAKTIEVPVGRVVTTSTTHLAQIVALGVPEVIVGHDEMDHVTSPEIHQRWASGLVAEVGSGPYLDVERVVALEPDLVVAYGTGTDDAGPLRRLEASGIPVLLTSAYMEASPLAAAEWIKLLALFLGRDQEAQELFQRVSRNYRAISSKARARAERPRILVGAPFQGTWWVPGGESTTARMITDAGGAYLWSDDPTSGGVPLDLESVYERALDADLWINPGASRSLADLLALDARLGDFHPVKKGRVFNNDGRMGPAGGNDFWEMGMVRPDLVLQDLVTIFHPELKLEPELVFYRRLPETTGVSSSKP